MYCCNSGETLFAVHPLDLPPPAPIERTLIETPHTFAAMLIGICALIGMFALSTLRSRARLLRTFERLTFTRLGTAPATLPTPEAAAEPALATPFAAEDTVLHAEVATIRSSAGPAKILRMSGSSHCHPVTRLKRLGSTAIHLRMEPLSDTKLGLWEHAATVKRARSQNR